MLKVALAVLIACGGVLAYELLRPREYFTGTNNAGSSGPVFHVDQGHELCIPGLAVPKGTARLRLQLAPLAATDVQYRVGAASGTAHVDATGGPGGSTPARLDVPAVGNTLCIKPSGPIDVAGRPQRFAGQPAPALDGQPAAGVAAVWFEPPPGQRRSLLSQLPNIARRAALFRPGIVGAWTYWLLLLAVPIAVLAAAIRLCLRPPRRAPLWVGVIAFVAAASWSLLTPILNAPDELEHVSYAQAIAEQGRGPSAAASRRGPYSTEAQAAYEGARLPGEYRQLLGRPPWTRAYEAEWHARDAHARGDDGGGWTTVAGYTPAYYAAVAPAYLAAKPWSFWSRVTAMRLMTALMAAVAAFFTVKCVREFLPHHEWAAVVAGLFVALQPMVSFMAGMVNNDAAVTMLVAAALYLVARGLRRGLGPWLAFALGAAAVAAPMAKGNGIFLLPAIAVGIAGMALRGRRLAAAPLAGGVVASLAAFVLLAAALHHSADPTNPGWYASTGSAFPTLPGAPVQPSKALHEPVRFAEYVWEMVLPPVAGMPDLRTGGVRAPAFQAYVIRGWGAFAFAIVQFPKWVYALICLVLAGLLGLGLALLRRTGVRGHGWEIAVLLVAVVGVVLGTEVAYYSPSGATIPEFGRYLFPAATAFAAMAAAALLGAPRHAAALGAGLVAALGILWLSGLWATAAQLYT